MNFRTSTLPWRIREVAAFALLSWVRCPDVRPHSWSMSPNWVRLMEPSFQLSQSHPVSCFPPSCKPSEKTLPLEGGGWWSSVIIQLFWLRTYLGSRVGWEQAHWTGCPRVKGNDMMPLPILSKDPALHNLALAVIQLAFWSLTGSFSVYPLSRGEMGIMN